jgi:hypothetical protein
VRFVISLYKFWPTLTLDPLSAENAEIKTSIKFCPFYENKSNAINMAAALIRKKSFLCSLMLHSTVRTIYGTTELQFDLKKSKTMKKILKKAERYMNSQFFQREGTLL